MRAADDVDGSVAGNGRRGIQGRPSASRRRHRSFRVRRRRPGQLRFGANVVVQAFRRFREPVREADFLRPAPLNRSSPAMLPPHLCSTVRTDRASAPCSKWIHSRRWSRDSSQIGSGQFSSKGCKHSISCAGLTVELHHHASLARRVTESSQTGPDERRVPSPNRCPEQASMTTSPSTAFRASCPYRFRAW